MICRAASITCLNPPAPPTGWPAGDLATIGIDGEASLVGGIDRIIEGADLTFLTESRIFEAHGREDGISVIELGELNILRPITSHLIGLAGRR